MIKKFTPLLLFGAVTIIFFWQIFLKGLVPIPADTIIGLYHPYRDFYSKDYPNGIPFKNFLITDPVRQQYPWKSLSVESIKNFIIPSWNPYSFSGTPHVANFQSGAFYPLNIMFLILPFVFSWVILVITQPLLAGIFMYFYLKNLKLDFYSSTLGGIVFAFGGFFTTWLEWGTVLHSALWLPLILLSIDKIFVYSKKISNLPAGPLRREASKAGIKYPPFAKALADRSAGKQISKIQIKNKKLISWFLILLLASISSFFAGHLQIFFYLSIVAFLYFFYRWFENGKKAKDFIVLAFYFIALVITTSVQWIPTLKFLTLSARALDQNYLTAEGWFIPWQHLIQFVAPDFFGNPTTLNYWGVWNYGELTPYIGIAPLIFGIYALFFKKGKNTLFFGTIFFVSLFFSLSTIVARLPFVLDIPFISTAQPTRLIFLIDFSFSVLCALGLNYFLKSKNKNKILLPILFVFLFFILVFGFVSFGEKLGIDLMNLNVAKRNLILPFLLFASTSILVLLFIKTNNKLRNYIIILIIFLTIFDLFRFSSKFNTFSKKEYIFPTTTSIEFLKKNIGNYRIATTDPRVFPPNFSSIYGIQSVEGYDPLFLSRYAEFVSAINRGRPDIAPPFGFNRIVRVEDFVSDHVDLLGVKYVLSLTDLEIEGFEKVFQEGQTRVYENSNVLPRAFFVDELSHSRNKQQSIDMIFGLEFNPLKTAIVEGDFKSTNIINGKAKIIKYTTNEVVIETESNGEGFLVLTDSFYSTWHVKINDQETKIYLTDYNFRGVFVPEGKNKVMFYNTLL